MTLVHPTNNLLRDVGKFLLVGGVLHVLDAVHGRVLVLVGQQPGLLETLGITNQLKCRLHVSRIAKSSQDQFVQLGILFTGKQDGGCG